ncbi:hypothetical protein HHK36_010792 [Tetracentron sinense]|uniref:Pentatricopeptide repeat-containing protein n=1 Tax=Tetracentron sinense TaxID=13715 RepID=A0A834Z801_TETSI|nr:hypothetical protein HHK36_010792 [Tetracentron sinense]
MVESGSAPDVVTCNALLNGFYRAGKINERVMSVLTYGLCENKYLKKALWVLKETEDGGVVLDILSLVNRLCGEGRLEETCSIFDLMCKHGFRPNSHIYNALINGFIQASKLTDPVFDRWSGSSQQWDSFDMLFLEKALPQEDCLTCAWNIGMQRTCSLLKGNREILPLSDLDDAKAKFANASATALHSVDMRK